MNIDSAVMNVPWGQAREAYRHYRTAITEKRATRDDVALYKGLRAVLRGAKVIDINLAIGNAGVDANARPKLAVCRADAPTCYLRGNNTGTGTQYTFSSTSSTWGRRPAGEVHVPISVFQTRIQAAWEQRAEAQVPSIPPQHRPTVGELRDYHILFEAVWRKSPPVDPLLLKRVDGPFFVVLAAWDLTPLEQAVLRQKL